MYLTIRGYSQPRTIEEVVSDVTYTTSSSLMAQGDSTVADAASMYSHCTPSDNLLNHEAVTARGGWDNEGLARGGWDSEGMASLHFYLNMYLYLD